MPSCLQIYFSHSPSPPHLPSHTSSAPPTHRTLGNTPSSPHPRPLTEEDWVGLGLLSPSKGSATVRTACYSYVLFLLCICYYCVYWYVRDTYYYRCTILDRWTLICTHSQEHTLSNLLNTPLTHVVFFYPTPPLSNMKRALDKTVRVGAANLVIAADALTRHINSLNTLSEQSGCISTFHKGKNKIVSCYQFRGWIEGLKDV